MDDDRIERSLRAGPVDEPDYRALAAGSVRVHRPRSRSQGIGGLLAAALVVAALVLGVAVIGPGRTPPPSPPPDLLARVLASGSLRAAVTTGNPQLLLPGSGYQGYDVDVANALGRRLGVAAEVDLVDPGVVETGGWQGRWDVALDSAPSTGRRAAVLSLGMPYYHRAAGVLVADASSVGRVADLAGHATCVVHGGLAQMWLAGHLDLVGGAATAPPTGITAIVADSPAACLAQVKDGTVEAFVADWAFDVPSVPTGIRQLDEVPFMSEVAPAVDPLQPGSATLLVGIDRAMSQLQADGTLRLLSEQRFGGQDLTASPAP